MIRAGTTCTVYAFTRTVQSGLPSVKSTQTFNATNVAWQDFSDFNCYKGRHFDKTLFMSSLIPMFIGSPFI